MKLVDILQRVPKGTKIWSPIYGDCELDLVFSYDTTGKPIWIKYGENFAYSANLGANGEICENIEGSECVIFPSRENRDWVKFARKFIPEGTHVMCCDGNMWVYGVMQKEGKVKTEFSAKEGKLIEPKYIVLFEDFKDCVLDVLEENYICAI